MARDYGAEIDQLKEELELLKKRLYKKTDETEAEKPRCSFCGKSRTEVCAMVAGPKVNICTECATLFENILKDTPGDTSTEEPKEVFSCSFCGKENYRMQKTIIKGKCIYKDATANICNECVRRSLDILAKASSEKKNPSNLITYSGSYDSGGRGSKWSSTVKANDLFMLIENKTAIQVLQGIGNNDRLNLLLAILQKPMNVASMVTACGFNTTGQVYHHLKPLIAADLVREEERGEKGVYVVVAHRVQGIIMILAGIADLVDAKYTEGDWSQAAVVHENIDI